MTKETKELLLMANRVLMSLLREPIVVSSTDREVWDKITNIKKDFILKGIVPEESDIIPPEVIYMWQLSKKLNIPYDSPASIKHLNEKELSLHLERKKPLLEIAEPLINDFHQLLDMSSYNMLLVDENGILITEPAYDKDNWEILGAKKGDILNFSTIGCTAHTMSIFYQSPVQIIGPVNYCNLLADNICSAAPIFNEKGLISGCVFLVQRNAELSKLTSHTLGWIKSIAMTITTQLQFVGSQKTIKLMDSAIKATFAHMDGACLSIDKKGNIINKNSAACTMLNLEDSRNKSFLNIINDDTVIKHALDTGRPIYAQTIELLNEPSVKLRANIEPFYNNRKHIDGAVIQLESLKGVFSDKKQIKRKSEMTFSDILSKSQVMSKLKERAKSVAEKPINTLLLGESGTGKELFARAIHNASGVTGPFVAINCASVPKNLIETELFGYEKGAFTGADREGHMGKIEYADGGTLFLDEIGDMPIDLQPVLLRVLEEKAVIRVGGHEKRPVNVRIVSATNKDLLDDVKENKFRQDLYYRLSTVSLNIPALKERGEDVLVLADNFIRNICDKFNLPFCSLSKECERILLKYSWPGNIRQLENAITYAVTVARKGVVYPDDLPIEITDSVKKNKSTILSKVKDMEHEIIIKAVKEAGSAEAAAAKLGISRATIYRKMKRQD